MTATQLFCVGIAAPLSQLEAFKLPRKVGDAHNDFSIFQQSAGLSSSVLHICFYNIEVG